MLFQTQVFVLGFLPLVLALYYLLAHRLVAREWVLIVASAIFYGWWDIRFLPLMVGQTIVSWAAARMAGPGHGLLLPLAIAGNLLILALFKYADFAVASIETILATDLPRSPLILPIGISFYTFHLVTYLVDLRRGEAPVYGLRRMLLYVMYFPQLVAGPIIRQSEIMWQFDLDPLRPGCAERIGRGAALFVLGLAKKIFIADKLAPVADNAFATATQTVPLFGEAWSGSFAFAFQLFFDFSAYSEMAIGIGLMMGLRLPDNFNVPYRARNIQDFWRRWHMTLSRFFRDYFYIPLGGSRSGPVRYVLATMATMTLCGLWHGAGWTFVVWGLLHGIALVLCRGWSFTGIRMPGIASWALTMTFVFAGWVIFRAVDFESASRMFAGLGGAGGWGGGKSWALIGLAAAISMIGPSATIFTSEKLRPRLGYAMAAGILLTAAVLEVGTGQPVTFIYFQF
ncbi:alginate O-acetylation protein [Agaricicola taiwanensis]|uniref:Probable alginate O-acetylase AlgI n=1 Tax=Agaricicola taiwanensis TaxID=591372 RepID=A0A8J2YL00_9RHOB|nr:MBOAT family protein [Agaricicola taiwanensis]GGE49912.1 alginate O-acetylation protein [Agaricicola taiwanensis]